MRLIKDRTMLRTIIDFVIYNWFLFVPILLMVVIYSKYFTDNEIKKSDKILEYIKYGTKREIISTTDGRAALADRVKLIEVNGTLELPSEIKNIIRGDGADVDLTIKAIKEYLYE